MARFFRYIALVIVGVVGLAGCRETEPGDARLLRVADIVSDRPEAALAALDSIDPATLAEPDRQYYNFLTLKASDKAYITHTSDSLILTLLDYYDGTALYPEMLYYGGRVYSDLGDLPTALEYFQKGLDQLPDHPTDPSSLHLKGNLLSQTARLLNKLRLNSEAIPYLEQAIEIDKLERDTFNLAYDHEFLGYILMSQKKYLQAEQYFKIASEYAYNLPEGHKTHMQMHLAASKFYQNKVDTALSLIRTIPDKIEPGGYNTALIYASDIYLAANLLDSAYLFADKLIHSPQFLNRKNGYFNIFKQELINYIPKDSIITYINGYCTDVMEFMKTHESQQMLMQHSLYNYNIHEREREKAENKYARQIIISALLLTVIFITSTIILILRVRRKSLLLKLNKTLHDLEILQREKDGNTDRLTVFTDTSDVQQLRNRIVERISRLKDLPDKKSQIPGAILNSDVFGTISRCVAEGKVIEQKQEIWDKLEEVILTVSPDFKSNLLLLTGNRQNRIEYQMCMLIKCGFNSTSQGVLLGRSRQAISYRRKNLCKILLGDTFAPEYLDRIITAL